MKLCRGRHNFKYAREHFALDALDVLDSYADQSDDPDRLAPNPAKARALAQVGAARGTVEDVKAGVFGAIEDAGVRAHWPGSGGKATVDPAADTALSRAQDDLATAKAASRATPSHLPLGQVRSGNRLLEAERKLLTHAIRMSAYNTESALANLLRPHYSHGQEEACALMREAFTLPGDQQIIGGTPTSGSTPHQYHDVVEPSPHSVPNSPTPKPATPAPT